MVKIVKPKIGDYNPYFQRYLDLVPRDGNLIKHLKDIQKENETLIKSLSEEKMMYRYAEGKWTIKEVMAHVCDTERVFAYRALCISRGDKTPLPSFDENLYALNARANERKTRDIMKEFAAVRASSISFMESLDEEMWTRMGIASNTPASVSAMLHLLYGHQSHHLNILRERYLV